MNPESPPIIISEPVLLNDRLTVILPQWKPHPSLATDPARLKSVQSDINAIPLLEQQAPVDGQVFATLVDANDRLLNCSCCAGFQIETASGGENKGRVRYTCIHGGKPRNTWKLKPEDRKRQTKTKKVRCPWSVTARLNNLEGQDCEFFRALVTERYFERLQPAKAWVL
ncbi:hypothetical protein K440DRAFT_677721 [Wilcoxina mikolae CBS 423.85]|nr:hypothetical protein K440DRAFT_677721 [Wilcoxina mikolae CBS 423.85]